MTITGIIFNQQKVVFGNSVPFTQDPLNSLGANPLQNIANVLQGNLLGSTAGIVIDATLTESHVLSAEVTNYPIESATPQSPTTVSDHVQLHSRVYQMSGVISDTPIGFLVVGNIGNVIGAINSRFFGNSKSTEVYYQLVALWQSRAPFTVTSNLQRYPNMIITNLTVDKDVDTANSISFKATLQQVNIVTSQSIPSQGQHLAPKVQQTGQTTNNQGQTVTDTTPDTDPNAGALVNFFDGLRHSSKGFFK